MLLVTNEKKVREMQFHVVHGSNVVVSDDKQTASRSNPFSFCNGLVFSNSPLLTNKPVSLQIKSSDQKWQGNFSMGLVEKDPTEYQAEKSVPKLLLASPDEQVWARSASQSWGDCRLVLILASNNDLVVIVNDDSPQVFLSKLPLVGSKSAWLALDLFGRTSSISFVTFTEYSSRIPFDIAFLGPQSLATYRASCKEASVPYSWGRILFVGPYKSGKTMLKRALLGLT